MLGWARRRVTSPWIGHIADWATIIGLISWAGVMTWAASAFDVIARHGWGAVVFAGTGLACVTIAALSLAAFAYRAVKPLPRLLDDRRGSLLETLTPDEKILDVISPATMGDDIQKLESRIGQIQRDLEPSLRELNRDVSIMLYYGLLQTGANIIDEFLDSAPLSRDVTLERLMSDPEALGAAQRFIEKVTSKIDNGLERRLRYHELLRQSAIRAEADLKDTPEDKRPKGDLLQIKDLMIIQYRYRNTLIFPVSERTNLSENLYAQRQLMDERYSSRNPQR